MQTKFCDPIEDEHEQLVREMERTIEMENESICDDRSWIHAAEIIFSRMRKLGLNNKQLKI